MEEFIVSARKYRPITFESVVGQSHITSTLRNAIKRGQLAHAYLFCGPRGVGKTTCARILAKSINCTSPGENMEPCNSCESCSAFNASSSFNIHELDAASNNSVDNIRDLTDQVRIPPQIGRYSVYIIDEVHMLSQAAFNAFLKTLEEPPAHAIFILATTEKHKILPTILSRCQIYDFRRIKADDIVTFLKHISSRECVSGDDESYHLIAQKSEGCMRDALSMFDKVVSFSGGMMEFHSTAASLNVLDYDSYFIFTELIFNGDYQGALNMFDEILQRGFDSTIFLSGLSSHLRDIMMAKSESTIKLLEVSGTLLDRFRGEAVKYDMAFIYRFMELLSGIESSLRTSLNQRLLVEVAIMKAANLGGKIAAPIKPTLAAVTQVVVQVPQGGVVTPQQVAQPAMQQVVQSSVQTTQQQPVSQVEQNRIVNSVNEINRSENIVIDKENISKNVEIDQNIKQSISSTSHTSVSALGLSIGAIIEENSKAIKSEKPQQLQVEIEEQSSVILDETSIIESCKQYAECIKNVKPRYYTIFNNAKFSDNKIVLTVPNQIIAEELGQGKQDILKELLPFCDVSYVDFVVEVEEYRGTGEDLLIKDEDKMKFMIEKNNAIGELCSKLSLDFC